MCVWVFFWWGMLLRELFGKARKYATERGQYLSRILLPQRLFGFSLLFIAGVWQLFAGGLRLFCGQVVLLSGLREFPGAGCNGYNAHTAIVVVRLSKRVFWEPFLGVGFKHKGASPSVAGQCV